MERLPVSMFQKDDSFYYLYESYYEIINENTTRIPLKFPTLYKLYFDDKIPKIIYIDDLGKFTSMDLQGNKEIIFNELTCYQTYVYKNEVLERKFKLMNDYQNLLMDTNLEYGIIKDSMDFLGENTIYPDNILTISETYAPENKYTVNSDVRIADVYYHNKCLLISGYDQTYEYKNGKMEKLLNDQHILFSFKSESRTKYCCRKCNFNPCEDEYFIWDYEMGKLDKLNIAFRPFGVIDDNIYYYTNACKIIGKITWDFNVNPTTSIGLNSRYYDQGFILQKKLY